MSDSDQPANDEKKCPRCSMPLGGNPPEQCPRCLLRPEWDTPKPIAITLGPGQSFKPPSIKELSEHLVGYEVDTLIGRGGMGAVYRGRQTSLDRPVAIKILPPVIADRPGFRERFAREAKALAKLNHPNIVAVYDYGQAGPYAMLVMELVEGANLREVLAQGRLTPKESMEIVPQLCDALSYAHETGVVHRDIKPENLLFDTRGRLKITDFGLAKLLGKASDSDLPDQVTQPNPNLDAAGTTMGVVGTIHYMAPEQLENPKNVDHRADIYALGVVFYEMLTGELPIGRFEPPSQRVAESQSDHRGDAALSGAEQGREGQGDRLQIDVRLDEVVLRALEKRPEKRYGSASELMHDIDEIESHPDKSASIHRVKEKVTSAFHSAVQTVAVDDDSYVKRGMNAGVNAAGRAKEAVLKEPWVDLPALIATLILVLGLLATFAFSTGPRGELAAFLTFVSTILGAFLLARLALNNQPEDIAKTTKSFGGVLLHFTLIIIYLFFASIFVIAPIAAVCGAWFSIISDVRDIGDPGWVRDWVNFGCCLVIGTGMAWGLLIFFHKLFPAVGCFLFKPYVKEWNWKSLITVLIILLVLVGAALITLPQTWFRPLSESDYASDALWHELSVRDKEHARSEMRKRDIEIKAEIARQNQ